jgi:hypothetical protein
VATLSKEKGGGLPSTRWWRPVGSGPATVGTRGVVWCRIGEGEGG